ncbi:MAG TPA: helix-turn-helix transcriptional regulator [Candidatus Obscuribacterales bacterium]
MSLSAIGRIILAHRMSLGLSRESLAAKANISPERLRMVENGEADDLDTVELLTIAVALNLTASSIIEEAELSVDHNGHCTDVPIIHGFIAN